ncbi:hypothetical protein IVB03_03020 [Bradyrhizobium sp. 168]|uniref:hypothetical protein n=1 Tax=Bradyrhizobium sp. 168 TaxID=2782639 RepID=UPI001FFB228A|nr:hypothetical protein [Bradyrhizobium sp. 168]MCK1578580.1 hypothetical protein [Bradyrhizobium sp. 168]
MNKAVDSKQLSLDDAGSSKMASAEMTRSEGTRAALCVNDAEDDFDWNTDDSIILREQRATAVYRNRRGELTFRQKADWGEERDSFVFVTPESEATFLDAAAAFLSNELEGGR